MGKKPSIEEKEDYILITNEDGSHVIVIVKEKLEALKPIVDRFTQLEQEHKPIKLTLVLLNKKENVDLIVSGWPHLIKKSNLSVLFVNPETNNKWSINPHIHDKIADKKSLKKGLLSIFESVEPV